MAEDIENDDQWLYGENPDAAELEIPTDQGNQSGVPEDSSHVSGRPSLERAREQPPETPGDDYPEQDAPPGTIERRLLPNPLEDDGPPGVDAPSDPENGEIGNEKEDGELKHNGDEEDLEDDSDDDDDDVNVVIGDIKATSTAASYTQQHSIKRGGLITIGDKSKQIQQSGKFHTEEFEHIGTINGVPASDYNLDSLEDKPWRKPGADITDYFNYGFNEDTWKAYCERQKRIRVNESGVGIMALNAIGLPRGPVVMNDVNKYQNQNYMPVPPAANDAPKMNTIQVMTADRREYSRKPGFPDMTMPPPMNYPEPFIPPPDFVYHHPEPEPFYGGGYEPTQDSQWMEGQGNPNWQPTEIKTLTGTSPPRPGHMMVPPPFRRSPSRRSSSRDRERERERDRESRSHSMRPKDHEREKSRRRERSRSRPKRHKSRSRSPTHRSHKKKKSSRRHDDSE